MTHLLLAIIGALQLPASALPAEISVLTSPGHYLEQQYSAGPAVGADYLFLTGESVHLEVLLVNRTDEPLTLVAAPGDFSRSIHLALSRRRQGILEQMPFPFVQDGPLQLTDSTGRRDIRWDGRIELVPKAILSLPLRLARSTQALAGVYELHVTPAGAQCEPSCVVNKPGGLFRFEIRTTTNQEEQLDLLARRVYQAIYYDSDFAAADAAIADMLRIYPRSVVAYSLKASAAEEQQDLKGAEENYARALSLATSGQDTLLRRPHGIDVEPVGAYLAQRLKAVQEARRKR